MDRPMYTAEEVTLTAFVEAVSTTDDATRVKCNFEWFAATGTLTEPVDAGDIGTWETSLLPGGEPAAADRPPVDGSQATAAEPGAETSEDSADAEPEQAPPAPMQFRFEKGSPALQATVGWIRQLAEMSLRVRLSFPDPRALEKIANGPAPPTPEEAKAAAAAKAKAKAKAEATKPATPEIPQLSLEVVLPMVHLIFAGRGGAPLVFERDFSDRLGPAKCSFLRSLRIGVSTQGSILSKDLQKHLNPLLVTIQAVQSLPEESKTCSAGRSDVFTVLDAFGERRKSTAEATDAEGTVTFEHHNVFYAGTWRRQASLRELLQSSRISVEVHSGLEAAAAEVNAGAAAGSKPSTPANPGAKKATLSPPGSADAVAKASQEEQKKQEKPPPFGIATFALEDLLRKRAPRQEETGEVFPPFAVELGASLLPTLGDGESGKKNFGRGGTVNIKELFGKGAKERLASMGGGHAKKFDFAPTYLDHGTMVVIAVRTAAPIEPEQLPELPDEDDGTVPQALPHERFGRVVLVADYRKTTVMKKLLALVLQVNSAALQLDASQAKTIASIQLTEEQRADASLDILTGFCVMDRQTRITVVEGLRGGALAQVMDLLGQYAKAASAKSKILWHPGIGFSERLYTDFNLTMKQIKLRQKTLERLMYRPDLYDRDREDKGVASALQCLMGIKRATRLQNLKVEGAFPVAKDIMSVETQYGDYVADEELAGGRVADDSTSSKGGSKSNKGSKVSRRSPPLSRQLSPMSPRSPTSPTPGQSGSNWHKQESGPGGEHPPTPDEDSDEDSAKDEESWSRNAPIVMKEKTDSYNLRFIRTLRERSERPVPDMVERNIGILKEQSNTLAATRTPRRFDVRLADSSCLDAMREVYIYSSQALNSAELQKRALRENMEGKEAKQLWTYSQEYMSGSFPMLEKELDPVKLLRVSVPVDDGRELWRLPKARAKKDFLKQTRDVSDARQEELSYPWVENELNANLEEPKQIMKGAFDSKTCGTGGRHVLPVRRPLMQEPYVIDPPPAEPRPPPMRCLTGYASMGQQAGVDKYHKTMLDGEANCLGFRFEDRKVPRKLEKTFGKSSSLGRKLQRPPVSINLMEEYQEPYKGNSEYPNQYAASVARPVKPRIPVLPIGDSRPQTDRSSKDRSSPAWSGASFTRMHGAAHDGTPMTARSGLGGTLRPPPIQTKLGDYGGSAMSPLSPITPALALKMPKSAR
eukprot:TRINITY_DN1534_c0_g1_i1.p1 TRINITY_DN1534_c0_g1~~TRINITY_DN1534_c0_g1_i1.p1  ORF type:complete len:1213 (-),score=294.69 TRINITY_DN1534_c0_g1_i1:276-3914(-)